MSSVQLEAVPNQTGTAVLDVDGNVLSSSGELAQRPDILLNIYNILLESGKCLQNEPLKRVTISYSDYSYLATIGKGQIYIVKVNQCS